MTEFVIVCDGEELPEESVRALENAMQGFVETDIPLCVEVAFVDGAEIQRLNREMRNIDKVTDVLSFPTLDGIKGQALYGDDYPYEIDEEGNLVIGSIAICCDRAKEQAEEYGHSYKRELHYLLVHGIMHCLGYDHMTEEEKAEMRKKEEYILSKLGITRE
ncbi:MAG: rRNA maturation RNase YbeY [Clostridiales bacterium]|nr:rRNA maturation RNase YbeY [Clostridiales bacterium]